MAIERIIGKLKVRSKARRVRAACSAFSSPIVRRRVAVCSLGCTVSPKTSGVAGLLKLIPLLSEPV